MWQKTALWCGNHAPLVFLAFHITDLFASMWQQVQGNRHKRVSWLIHQGDCSLCRHDDGGFFYAVVAYQQCIFSDSQLFSAVWNDLTLDDSLTYPQQMVVQVADQEFFRSRGCFPEKSSVQTGKHVSSCLLWDLSSPNNPAWKQRQD